MAKRIAKIYALGMIAVILGFAAELALGGIAVSPLQQWVTVKPGKEAFFAVTVTNTIREQQTSPQTVAIELVNFEITPQGGISFGKEFTHPRSALKLITLQDDDGQFVLEPGQSRQIKAKVSAPINADGDYWGAVMIKIINPQKNAKGVTVNLQTASGIFIHVPRKNYTPQGVISNANITLPDFSENTDPNQATDVLQKSTLQITAELKNNGVVTFLGNGKAYLYTDKMKRFASIPLYTMRRQTFPGQSRMFTGVLSDAIAPGAYKMRVIFEPVLQLNEGDVKDSGRTFYKDLTFTVSRELAAEWSKKSSSSKTQHLKYEPEELKLTVTPGRFTSVSVLVENSGVNTVTMKMSFDKTVVKDWFKSESDHTTFGPNMKRNIVFSLNIPKDVEAGDYTGVLILEAERSGINTEDVTEKMKIPIMIKIVK
jgi:hypothetical protein